MGPGPDGVRIVRPAMCQPSDPAEPGDRPQNRSRFCSLRVLITQNPVGKRLCPAIFHACVKFARIQVGLPTPATVRKIAPDFATRGF